MEKKTPFWWETYRKKLKFDQRIIIFSFFLFISTIFWFLSALGKEYSVILNFPVTFQNFPANKDIVNTLPSQFSIKINALGFTIMKYKYSRKRVNVDISWLLQNRYKQISSGRYYYLPSYVLQPKISEQLTDLKILDIQPDTLIFRFGEIVYKKVPVKLNDSITFAPQYTLLNNKTLTPNEVTFSGAKTLLDSLKYAETETLVLENLERTVSRELRLLPIPNVKIEPDRVKVTIPVERYTEGRVEVPVEVLNEDNLPENTILKTSPPRITITYRVGLSHFNKIVPNQFRAVVDFDTIQKNNRLRIKIVRSPDAVIYMTLSQYSVDYVLEKSKK